MPERQTQKCPELPEIWLISDSRNDAMLEQSLAALPRGSGFIYRHYHLSAEAREARFKSLKSVARRYGHIVILAGPPPVARCWRADGVYGAAEQIRKAPAGLLRLATAHSLREVGEAGRIGADAVLLSPVFSTRSHPGGKLLGPLRFRLLAQRAAMPVIALGGMTRHKAAMLARGGPLNRDHAFHWAAIDGLSRRNPVPRASA
ncbi:thiamine phosphate synthase [Altericroceibacterium spongiae]|uniref:Thiamine phosphate synthase n=2 Tax=Altericroceibacterium spongiae TaxID=2320269 RepID=A0A420EPB6_9SPHN|nr:thiamine phosphate synthase [Altericroceibacterium spongiae]RKF22515.1 thiamine phosphate synthase [Altericroceibacterium spongiae]